MMTALEFSAAPLSGTFVRLEPMTPDMVSELVEALYRPEVFAGGYGGGPSAFPESAEAFIAFLQGYLPFQGGTPYLVRINGGLRDGTPVGSSSLSDYDTINRSLHLGWTGYDPRVWGTAVNAETKLLLLGSAFDAGFERVRLQADALNERSIAAIRNLGAVYEGTIRHERLRPDGSWRDTVIFSILAAEWPAVKEGIQQRLLRWEDRPVLFRSMG